MSEAFPNFGPNGWLMNEDKAAVVKLIDYGAHHPDSSQGGGIKNKNNNK